MYIPQLNKHLKNKGPTCLQDYRLREYHPNLTWLVVCGRDTLSYMDYIPETKQKPGVLEHSCSFLI